MSELSRLADMAEILGVLIVIGGVFFAVMQMRQIRQQRREMAAIELFRFFGSPDFAGAYHDVLGLPDDIGIAEFRSRYADVEPAAMLIATTMENIGVMVYHRIVPSVVVSNLLGTTAIVLWNKIAPWVRNVRKELDNPSAFEWFEWLATILEQLHRDDEVPAYELHKDWRPSRTTESI